MPEVNKTTQLNNKEANPEFGEKPSAFLQKVQNRLNGRTFRFLGDITGISDIYAATTNTEQSDEDADFLLRKGLVKLGGCGLAVAGAIYCVTRCLTPRRLPPKALPFFSGTAMSVLPEFLSTPKAPPSFSGAAMSVLPEFLSTQEAKDCLKSREIGSEACAAFFEKVDREIDDMNLCLTCDCSTMQQILPRNTLRAEFFQLAHSGSNTDTVRQAMGIETRIAKIMAKIEQLTDSNFPGPKLRAHCKGFFETKRTYNPIVEELQGKHEGSRTGLEWIEYALNNRADLICNIALQHSDTLTKQEVAAMRQEVRAGRCTLPPQPSVDSILAELDLG